MTVQFVSALELATYFDGTTDIGDLSAAWIAQADLLLEMISADVEAAAGIPIEAGSGTVLLPGTWSRDLILPSGPIVAVAAVAVNGTALSSGEFTWNDRALLRRGETLGFADDVELYERSSSGQGAQSGIGISWGGPASTVAVDYSFGFAGAVPDVARSLVFRIAARTITNVAQITQESLGPYSVSYGQSTNTNDGSHVTSSERKRLRNALGSRNAGTVTLGGR